MRANSDGALIAKFKKLDFAAQQATLSELNHLFENSRQGRVAELLAELDKLGEQKKAARTSKTAGKKVAAKFRSKKNPSLTWSGRGLTPRWMKEEMTASGKKKEEFRIK